MIYPEFKYAGFKNRVDSKTLIYDLSEKSVFALSPNEEAYASVYRFDDSVEELGSLGSIPEDTKFFADFVHWDFDSKDLNTAYDDLKTLAKRLDQAGAKYFCFYSGNKGFHLSLPS